MGDCKVSIISSLEDWKGLSGAWNDVLSKSGSDTLFLTWEWLYSWAECYLNGNRSLFILTVSSNGELVGIAPWSVRHIDLKAFTLKQIEFLGTPETGSDYLDVFIKRGKEREVTECIYDFLLKDVPTLWDYFSLTDIPSNSLFLLHLLNRINSEGKYAEVNQGAYCPIVFLPESGADFISSLSPNRRQQFRRHYNVLGRSGATEHYCSFPSRDKQASLQEFLSFYKAKKKQDDGRLPVFIENFASRCTDDKTIRVDLLKSGGNPIAGILHLRYQNTLSLYLMATDKAFNPKISIGNILVGLCISSTRGEGISTYDFLKGSESYKFHWANGGRSSVKILFCRKKIIPILFVIKNFLKYTAKVIFR